MLVFFLVLSGCGVMKPSPIYTSEKGSSEKAAKPNRTKPTRSTPLTIAVRLTSPIKLSMLTSIDRYRGVPYKWGGDTMKGMDCSGFTMKVFGESANLNIPHNAAAQYKLGAKINRRQLKFGDLVFFRDIESKGVSHVGIYIGDETFVHASLSKGVINSSMNQDYYKKRYVTARRILR